MCITKNDKIKPDYFNVEITTICNSKCRFCTHETLTKSIKKHKHMDYESVKMVIDRFSDIAKELHIPDNEIRFGPVGLGEPLLHPRFFDIIAYARKVFPRSYIHANTNCIALSKSVAAELIGSELDSLVLSLRYNEPVSYHEWSGVDPYDKVKENIQYFLHKKGKQSPSCALQIFDTFLNRKEYARFMKQWSPFFNSNDSVNIEKYLHLTEWENIKIKKYPCSQLWSILMVDIEGFVYPCCLAVWIADNAELRLGHIMDDFPLIMSKVMNIRQKHMTGNFGICTGCSYLREQRDYCKRFYRQLKQLER